jgi:hypothetical protein
MSENPNPTRCGNCGTLNPPGQEFCIKCDAPLTLTAGAAALEGMPEIPDELKGTEGGRADAVPEMIVMGGMGGAAIPVPAEPGEPEPNRPPRD